MTWHRTSFMRRIRADVDCDPARPHLTATTVAAALVGVTGPLVLAGVHRRTPDLPWPLAVVVIVLWAVVVITVLERVLPWQALVLRGLRRESRALVQVHATERERRWFHLRWLLVSTTWAVAAAVLPVALVALVVAHALAAPPSLVLAQAAVSLGLGAFASNLPTLVACAREARCASRRTGAACVAPLPTRGRRW